MIEIIETTIITITGMVTTATTREIIMEAVHRGIATLTNEIETTIATQISSRIAKQWNLWFKGQPRKSWKSTKSRIRKVERRWKRNTNCVLRKKSVRIRRLISLHCLNPRLPSSFRVLPSLLYSFYKGHLPLVSLLSVHRVQWLPQFTISLTWCSTMTLSTTQLFSEL